MRSIGNKTDIYLGPICRDFGDRRTFLRQSTNSRRNRRL